MCIRDSSSGVSLGRRRYIVIIRKSDLLEAQVECRWEGDVTFSNALNISNKHKAELGAKKKRIFETEKTLTLK